MKVCDWEVALSVTSAVINYFVKDGQLSGNCKLLISMFHRPAYHIDLSTKHVISRSLHITCLWPVTLWSRRVVGYRWEGCQASNHCLRQCLNICKQETVMFFMEISGREASILPRRSRKDICGNQTRRFWCGLPTSIPRLWWQSQILLTWIRVF